MFVLQGHTQLLGGLCTQPAQNRFVSAGLNGTVTLWDAADHRVVWSVSLPVSSIPRDWICLVDLWVIKIKKPMILCAHSTSRSSEQSMKWKRFFKILVKITRLYDYQTRQTHFGEIHEVRKGMWVSWLCFSGADWLDRQTVITWTAMSSFLLQWGKMLSTWIPCQTSFFLFICSWTVG